MNQNQSIVVYWDTSAIVSALFKDAHSEVAFSWARREGVHLISTLALAETYAVISRIHRERFLAGVLVEAAVEALENGPWRQLHIGPKEEHVKKLASKWPLRGADLWHLATAKTLQAEIPELVLLTFDNRLKIAAQGEELSPDYLHI
ncbi:MAG: type II toxin-antitoxin system VapC family toxin [Peptococcaceae bacterium]|nr:type II toxin-antitoxin system VapC family toxin [Peptococcaceae bacterium]